MTKRREFTRDVSAEIVKRAKDATGALRCEKCFGVVVRGEIHHLKEDALEIDKSRKLTAKDGQFLCEPCHDELTKAFAPIIAKVKRVEAKALGITRAKQAIKSAGFAKSTKPKHDRQQLAPRAMFIED